MTHSSWILVLDHTSIWCQIQLKSNLRVIFLPKSEIFIKIYRKIMKIRENSRYFLFLLYSKIKYSPKNSTKHLTPRAFLSKKSKKIEIFNNFSFWRIWKFFGIEVAFYLTRGGLFGTINVKSCLQTISGLKYLGTLK